MKTIRLKKITAIQTRQINDGVAYRILWNIVSELKPGQYWKSFELEQDTLLL